MHLHGGELGKEQIKTAAAELKPFGVCRIISSPAGRAQQSAALLAHILGVEKSAVDARIEPMKGRTVPLPCGASVACLNLDYARAFMRAPESRVHRLDREMMAQEAGFETRVAAIA